MNIDIPGRMNTGRELTLTDVQLAARAQKRALVLTVDGMFIPLSEYTAPATVRATGRADIRYVAWPWSLAAAVAALPVDVDVARAEADV